MVQYISEKLYEYETGLCAMLDGWENRIPAESLKPWFILTQGGELISVASRPYHLIDAIQPGDFTILIGTINEFGNYEVLGTCAEYHKLEGETVWSVTSPLDGPARRVGVTGNAGDFIISRLSTLYKNGRFNDLMDYPQVSLVGVTV